MEQGTNQGGPGDDPPGLEQDRDSIVPDSEIPVAPPLFFIEDEPTDGRHQAPPIDFRIDDGPVQTPPEGNLAPQWATASPHRGAPASLDLALLRGALEEIPLGVATTRSGQILYANSALERLYGAAPGGLEEHHVAMLFEPKTFMHISNLLDEKRIFDGRIKALGVDGRTIDAEVHAEWYSSESLGIGGFLVFRDVSFELGALGKIVDQLGGALFRVNSVEGTLEYVSPSIVKLAGIEAATCVEHPVLLTNVVSADERERLLFLYRRVASGELATATAQVSLRRADGRMRVIQIRVTGRRDMAGVVHHMDGVATDVTRGAEEAAHLAQPDAPPNRASARRREAANVAPAVIELTQEILREASQHLHSLSRALGHVKALAQGERVPLEMHARLDRMTRAFEATSSLNRRARQALAGAAPSAPVGQVLEQVRATLAPVIGASAITTEPGVAASVMIEQRVDELTLALTWLALRAFRAAGSGSLRLEACRAAPLPPDPRVRPRVHTPVSETQDTLLTILGLASPESLAAAIEITSEMQANQRSSEGDQGYAAAKAILAAAGATIEVDSVTIEEACTVIRLKGQAPAAS